MSRAKHTPTPGPWRMSEVSYAVLAPSHAKDADGEPHYWRVVAEVPAEGPSPTDVLQRHATAQLIAAAPDLLEASEGLLAVWDHDKSVSLRDLDKLRAAIAKAKGNHVDS